MVNSRANSNTPILDHHKATGTEATYTITKSLNMQDTYRYLILQIDGTATAALALQLKVNAITDYNYSTLLADTTTVTNALTDAGAVIPLIPNTLIDAGALPFSCRAILTVTTFPSPMVMSHASVPHEGSCDVNAEVVQTQGTISSIEIKTSTSTWATGTEITLYGVKR